MERDQCLTSYISHTVDSTITSTTVTGFSCDILYTAVHVKSHIHSWGTEINTWFSADGSVLLGLAWSPGVRPTRLTGDGASLDHMHASIHTNNYANKHTTSSHCFEIQL